MRFQFTYFSFSVRANPPTHTHPKWIMNGYINTSRNNNNKRFKCRTSGILCERRKEQSFSRLSGLCVAKFSLNDIDIPGDTWAQKGNRHSMSFRFHNEQEDGTETKKKLFCLWKWQATYWGFNWFFSGQPMLSSSLFLFSSDMMVNGCPMSLDKFLLAC